ncbi:MAG: hypothetical protein ACOY3P_07565 [Planctomycetota bacterium]
MKQGIGRFRECRMAWNRDIVAARGGVIAVTTRVAGVVDFCGGTQRRRAAVVPQAWQQVQSLPGDVRDGEDCRERPHREITS